MRKHVISSLLFVQLDITQSDQIYPSTLWDMPSGQRWFILGPVQFGSASYNSINDIYKNFFQRTIMESQLKQHFRTSKFAKQIHSNIWKYSFGEVNMVMFLCNFICISM